ncbi:hypothetical protein [Actinoplanes sp. DH11]|uniref:hypothetical protein n=1 Tax=Actinoplanes sp. DH11 TaxID=2857011 RepID=UPI001E3141AC|nr:hypothetical protein [Actinoplanes sp. DH11]
MTLTDRPRSLDDLLRGEVLTDDPLGAVVVRRLTDLLLAVEELTYTTSIAACAGGGPRPDQEAMMRRGEALRHRLRTFFQRDENSGPAPAHDPATATVTPAATQPPATRPVTTQPPTTQPAGTQPAATQPVVAQASVAQAGADRPAPMERTRPGMRAGGEERGRVDAGVAEVLTEFATSPLVQRFLGADPLPGRTAAERWRAFHFGLLRLHRDPADEWRRKLGRCLPPEWNRPQAGWGALAAEVDPPLVLIPAYHDLPGVVAHREAMAEEMVIKAFSDRVLSHRQIPAIASQMLWLAGEDRSAFYARKSELVPARTAYSELEATLRDKLIAYRNAEKATDGASLVVRAAQLAEVLRSVVHRPLPSPESWWADSRAAAMQFVRETASRYAPQLKVRDLGVRSLYKDLLASGEAELENDIRLKVDDDADVGKIFDCLRPSLLADNSVFRSGRVIYGGELDGSLRGRR